MHLSPRINKSDVDGLQLSLHLLQEGRKVRTEGAGILALSMLEYDLADDLLEDHALPSCLCFLASLAENPPFQLIISAGIHHVDLGQQRIEIGEVVYLLQAEDHLFLLGWSLAGERLYRQMLLVPFVRGAGGEGRLRAELTEEEELFDCSGVDDHPHSFQTHPLCPRLLYSLSLKGCKLGVKKLAVIAAEFDLPALADRPQLLRVLRLQGLAVLLGQQFVLIGLIPLILFVLREDGVEIAKMVSLALDTALRVEDGLLVGGGGDAVGDRRGQQRCLREQFVIDLRADHETAGASLVRETAQLPRAIGVQLQFQSLLPAHPAPLDGLDLPRGGEGRVAGAGVRTGADVETEALIEEALEGALEGGLDDGHHIVLAGPPTPAPCVVLQEAGLELSSQELVAGHEQLQALSLRPLFLLQLFVPLSVPRRLLPRLPPELLAGYLLPQDLVLPLQHLHLGLGLPQLQLKSAAVFLQPSLEVVEPAEIGF